MKDVWIVPKNIRQVGESHGRISIYIEDYAATFISQFAKASGECIRQGICLGKIYEDTERINIVIEGIVVDQTEIGTEERLFEAESENRMKREADVFFDREEVIGRFALDYEIKHISDACLMRLAGDTKKQSHGRIQFVMLASTENGIVRFYISAHGTVECLENYYIYYDKNELMQNYLINWHEKLRKEKLEENEELKEQDKIRRYLEQKAQMAGSVPTKGMTEYMPENRYGEKRAFPFVECAACLILICACVMGIASINNYQKMKDFEVAMESVFVEEDIAETSGDSLVNEETNGDSPVNEETDSTVGMDLPLYNPENIQGNVSEQSNETEEVGQETEETNKETQEQEQTAEDATVEEQNIVPQDRFETEDETTDDQETVEAENVETQTVSYQEYVVKQGDTLSGICYHFYQDRSRVSEICQINGITDPDKLSIGQKILLP